jgi:hypothetical protein
MAEKRGRGRPPVYKGNVEKHIAGLVRKFGATKARTILNASADSEQGSKRSVRTVPNALGISMPTILRIAKTHGVKLYRGRPKGSVKVVAAAA